MFFTLVPEVLNPRIPTTFLGGSFLMAKAMILLPLQSYGEAEPNYSTSSSTKLLPFISLYKLSTNESF